MKTININLIGDLAKAPEYNKAVLQKDDLDLRTRLYVVIFISTVVVVFIICFGLWFVTDTLSKRTEGQLAKLRIEHEELQAKETRLTQYNNDIKNKLKIGSYKKLARENINKTYIPWSLVLDDLATKIPKDITVLDISKTTSAKGNSNTSILKIAGRIPARNAANKPITSISYLLLNINEDKNSLLGGAEAQKIEFKNEQNIYEFEVTARLKANIEEILKQRDEAIKKAQELEKAKAKPTIKTIEIPIKAVNQVMEAAKHIAKAAKPVTRDTKLPGNAIKPVEKTAKLPSKAIKTPSSKKTIKVTTGAAVPIKTQLKPAIKPVAQVMTVTELTVEPEHETRAERKARKKAEKEAGKQAEEMAKAQTENL